MISVTFNGEVVSASLESFVINEDDVDGELCRAGRDLAFYANLAADLKAQSVSRKAELEMTEATISQTIRGEVKAKNEKITEGGIKEKVTTNKDRIEKLNRYIEAEKDFQRIENLFRSQQKKVDCLIALAYKQRTEIAKVNY